MNWEAFGAIGEILGAAAVVVSLVYLAIQIRIQNKESRLAATHEISVGFRESLSSFLDADLVDIFLKANKNIDSLNDNERLRLLIGMQRIYRLWEEAYHQHTAGRLDARVWNAMVSLYSSYLAAPGFSVFWELRKQHYDAEFREYVDALPRSSWSLHEVQTNDS
ncbi:MAG: hypothetical protein P8X81_05180 [Woeseiaceae bacterium]|jgi:phytoene dehydrogenase-like protein